MRRPGVARGLIVVSISSKTLVGRVSLVGVVDQPLTKERFHGIHEGMGRRADPVALVDGTQAFLERAVLCLKLVQLRTTDASLILSIEASRPRGIAAAMAGRTGQFRARHSHGASNCPRQIPRLAARASSS